MKHEELKVAMQAWEQANEGVNENFKGYRVVKRHDLVILMPLVERWPTREKHRKVEFHVVAFPRPEHVSVLQQVAEQTQLGGPADIHHGAVGTIKLCATEPGYMEISSAQGHFKALHLNRVLDRRQTYEYSKWRKPVLEDLINLMRQRGLAVKINRKAVYPRGHSSTKRSDFHQNLIDISGAVGSSLEETETHFLLR